PERIAQPEALVDLRVEVKLSAFPQSSPDETGRRDGVAGLASAEQAVRSLIGRTEARVALLDERRLAVDRPVAPVRRIFRAAGLGPGRCQPIVQAEFEGVNVGRNS